MAALAFWVPWAAMLVVVGVLMFCAWYGPDQDMSNLSRWAWLAGWHPCPHWLRAQTADRWMVRGGIVAVVLLVAGAGLRLFWPTPTPEAPHTPMPEIVRPPLASPAPAPPQPSPLAPPAVQRPDRELNATLEQAIRANAAKDKQIKLVVLAGDAEAARFADQIEAFLKNEGYHLAPRVAFAGGPSFTGTRLFSDANDPKVFVIQVGPNDRD